MADVVGGGPKQPSREPIESPDPSELEPDAGVDSALTPQERIELCRILRKLEATGERASDLVLDGLAVRGVQFVKSLLPVWIRWIPLPVQAVRDKLDEYLPEALTRPLLEAIGCAPTELEG